MPVNANKSGARLLAVVEQIARSQPIGVRALARTMGLEKSAVQRAVTTLAEAGWVRADPAAAGAWELTGRILNVAQVAHGSDDLRQRARPVLERLRDRSGETAYLAVPDVDGLVVVEVAESRQALRLVMPIGTILDATNSAAGRAVLPYLEEAERNARLASRSDLASCDFDISPRGYYLPKATGLDNSLSIAVPVYDVQGRISGALAIYAVGVRVSADDVASVGDMLAAHARELAAFGRTDVRLRDPRQAIGSFG